LKRLEIVLAMGVMANKRGLRSELNPAVELVLSSGGDRASETLAFEAILGAINGGTSAERTLLRHLEPMACTYRLPRDGVDETLPVPLGLDDRDEVLGYGQEGLILFEVPQLYLATLPRPERFVAHASMSTCSLVVGGSETALVAAHVSYSLRRQAEAALAECRRAGCTDITVVASVGIEQQDGHDDRVGLCGPKVQTESEWKDLGATRTLGFQHRFESGVHRGLVHALVSDRSVIVFQGDWDRCSDRFDLRRTHSLALPALRRTAPPVWERLEGAARLARGLLLRHAELGGSCGHASITALSDGISALLDDRAAFTARADAARTLVLVDRFAALYKAGTPAPGHPESWVIQSALRAARAATGRSEAMVDRGLE